MTARPETPPGCRGPCGRAGGLWGGDVGALPGWGAHQEMPAIVCVDSTRFATIFCSSLSQNTGCCEWTHLFFTLITKQYELL